MLLLSTHLAGPRRRAACEHRRPSLEPTSRGQQRNGNRTTATVNGTTVNPTYDDQDRLLTYGSTTFTYTANGEVRTKTDASGTTTYTYDAMGSLIAVSMSDGRLIEYVTDGKGRRIGKRVNGLLTKQWLYRSQLKPVAELDGSGNLVSQFIYGTKPNMPDLIIRVGNTFRVVSDELGSPVLAINTANSSDVPFQATYTTWGDRTLVAGSDDWMPFGFIGGQYDPDTKLTRLGARDFDSAIGRWVSKDPVRFKGRQSNIYVYVANDPVNKSDPAGLQVGSFLKACGKAIWKFDTNTWPLKVLSYGYGLAAEQQEYQDLQCAAAGIAGYQCCLDSMGYPYKCDDSEPPYCQDNPEAPQCHGPEPPPNMCPVNYSPAPTNSGDDSQSCE